MPWRTTPGNHKILIQNLRVFECVLKGKPMPDDFFRSRLDQMINHSHPLAVLASWLLSTRKTEHLDFAGAAIAGDGRW
jgi:hypothetical protein